MKIGPLQTEADPDNRLDCIGRAAVKAMEEAAGSSPLTKAIVFVYDADTDAASIVFGNYKPEDALIDLGLYLEAIAKARADGDL